MASVAPVAAIARISLGAALGFCWGAPVQALALLPLLGWAWGTAQSRAEAGGVALAYYAVATRGLAGASAEFWGLGALEQAVLLLGVSSLYAAPWAALWSETLTKSYKARALRGSAALLLALVPGWAAISVTSPLTAAGVLLPGLGWAGLVATAVLTSQMAQGARAAGVWATCAALGLSLGGDEPQPAGFAGVDTNLATPQSADDFWAQGDVALEAMPLTNASTSAGAKLTLLPEGTGGVWTEAMQSLWTWPAASAAAQQRTVALGALVPAGEGYDSALVLLGQAEPAYVQRYPAPGAMWRPWSPNGAVRAHWTAAGTANIGGQRAGVLICFEQLLVLPVLTSVAEGAEVLLAPANHRWTGGTNVPASQRAAMAAWGRLFSLPVVRAFNA